MAEMTAAAAAMYLAPLHAEVPIVAETNGVVDRGIEAWPTRAAVEFGLGLKERRVAAGAGEDAVAFRD
jgi:hypothetical protein